MTELTRVERDRLDGLKSKAPHPSGVAHDPAMRTEGEEIEHRRLAERFEGEERLAALRAQPERSRDDLLEMEVLGAPAEEVGEERRKLALVEARERGAGNTNDDGHNRPGGLAPEAGRGRAGRAMTPDEQRAADEAASPEARQRAESDRIARDVDRVQSREAADRGDQHREIDAPAAAPSGLANQRLAELRAMPNRTPEQDAELARLEGSPA